MHETQDLGTERLDDGFVVALLLIAGLYLGGRWQERSRAANMRAELEAQLTALRQRAAPGAEALWDLQRAIAETEEVLQFMERLNQLSLIRPGIVLGVDAEHRRSSGGGTHV